MAHVLIVEKYDTKGYPHLVAVQGPYATIKEAKANEKELVASYSMRDHVVTISSMED
jgi:hypothetical protein